MGDVGLAALAGLAGMGITGKLESGTDKRQVIRLEIGCNRAQQLFGLPFHHGIVIDGRGNRGVIHGGQSGLRDGSEHISYG